MIDTKKISIGENTFYWGLTLGQTMEVFNMGSQLCDKTKWPSYRVDCDNFLGLKTLACQFTSSNFYKPVFQLRFDLCPKEMKILDKSYSPFLRHLIKHLGNPIDAYINTPKNFKYNVGIAHSYTIYECYWVVNDIRITISVYGGLREEKEGKFAATLCLNWEDDIKIANPYIEDYLYYERILLSEIEDIRIIKTEYRFHSYRKSYSFGSSFKSKGDSRLRTSQLLLYTNQLYATPHQLSCKLEGNDLVLFKSGVKNIWCLGNKWEFTPITKDSTLNYTHLYPDKGRGCTELKIDDIYISHLQNQDVLKELSFTIEELTGFSFKRQEGYDF